MLSVLRPGVLIESRTVLIFKSRCYARPTGRGHPQPAGHVRDEPQHGSYAVDRPVDRYRIAGPFVSSAMSRRCNSREAVRDASRAPVVHTLVRLITCLMEQGLLVVEHRAEIARVKPVFKEVKLNLFSQWRRNATRHHFGQF